MPLRPLSSVLIMIMCAVTAVKRQFGVSKNSFIKACSMVDYDLELHPVINSFYSGTAAVTIIRQGDLIMLANVGDSRAVLGTTSDDGEVIAVQLTVDFKPSLPRYTQ
ncbi:putative PPM-type phosphatase domain, protein phosphatase 2C family [Helianthus anomalus]